MATEDIIFPKGRGDREMAFKLFWEMRSHGFSVVEAQAIAELSDAEVAEAIQDGPVGDG